MSNVSNPMRGVSALLLSLGTVCVIATAICTVIAVSAGLSTPFPGVVSEVNDFAPVMALVAAAVSASLICGGLMLRR